MRNYDELYVLNIANQIPKVEARLSTPEEDCGYKKADVVLNYLGQNYYIQVSHQPKSKKERKKLLGRGTYAVHTHAFSDIPLQKSEIKKSIEDILNV